MSHAGTEPQKLHVVHVCIAGNQFHVRIGEEGGKEASNTVEAFACPREILNLAYHLRLPVLRARLHFSQFGETPVEQKKVRGQRRVRELRILHATRRADPQVYERTGFEHRVVQT